jgi:hypothetical protein
MKKLTLTLASWLLLKATLLTCIYHEKDIKAEEEHYEKETYTAIYDVLAFGSYSASGQTGTNSYKLM